MLVRDIFSNRFFKFPLCLDPVIKFMARFKTSAFRLVKGKFSNFCVTVR